MRILLTNDDGHLAPGLHVLERAVADLGEVTVVAPHREQTGVSHAVTVRTPMRASRMHFGAAGEAWVVDGRPADCVKLACLKLLDERPDFVISGINAGLNTGVYTLYSGTVAAAAEAAVFFGIPSMAVSVGLSEHTNFSLAARIVRQVFEHYVASCPSPGACINVNIPALDGRPPKGVRVCRLDPAIGPATYQEGRDAGANWTYALIPGAPAPTGRTDTDTQAVLAGYVAITALRFDFTDREGLEALAARDWPESFT